MSAIRFTVPAVLSFVSVAHADLDLQWDGMLAFEQIYYSNVSSDNSVSWDAAERERSSYAHAGILDINDGALNLVCIELAQSVTSESVPYTISPFESGDDDYERSLLLSSLFTNSFDAVLASESTAMAAAFAMMTWEIMTENFDGGPEDMVDQVDIELGAVQFGDYSVAAREFFDAMKADLFVASSSDNLITYRNDEYQDFAGQVPGPGGLALLFTSGLLTRRRRRS
ncbi:MAG: hypothetical protein CMJ34_04605 [Phycisphaerae bacterium]|nr:hypothetical protein [Phycisphaerae bacterium]